MKNITLLLLCATLMGSAGCADASSAVDTEISMTESETAFDTSEGTETGDTDDGNIPDLGGDGDGDGDTGEPSQNPGPDEPCDPILAATGVAPCEHPTEGLDYLTCAASEYMSSPGEWTADFYCQAPMLAGGDVPEVGDACSYTNLDSCMNAWCLSNGDPASNTPDNHAPGACPFYPDGPEGSVSLGCCVPYCDMDTPCPGGTQVVCIPLNMAGLNTDAPYGVCTFVG